MELSEEQKEIALGDFDKWHKEHAKYMEPADIVHWCREAWESSRASLPKPWLVAWANMQEDGVTPCLLSISQHPEDRANWLNPVPLYTGNTLITQPEQENYKAQREAERYRWLRDHSKSWSWNPSQYNKEIVSGFAAFNTGYLGFEFESAIDAAIASVKGGSA